MEKNRPRYPNRYVKSTNGVKNNHNGIGRNVGQKKKVRNGNKSWKNAKSDISVKNIKNTVTRPISSSIKKLKAGAEKYTDNTEGEDNNGYKNPAVFRSPFLSRQRRNNELLEMIKALVKIIKAVIISMMTPVLIALAVVYLIVSTVVSILYGDSGSQSGDIVGPPIVIDDDSTPGDADFAELLWPCPSVARGEVTSTFGYREAPTEGASTYHAGIDIGAAYGADIVAVDSGVVIKRDYNSIRGNYVVIDHRNGMQSWYQHMSGVAVQEGDIIERGNLVGKCGDSGIATGPHLHFEIHVDGEQVDPLMYFK